MEKYNEFMEREMEIDKQIYELKLKKNGIESEKMVEEIECLLENRRFKREFSRELNELSNLLKIVYENPEEEELREQTLKRVTVRLYEMSSEILKDNRLR
ncbi:hypothetical protein [Bacillus sp. FSL M8-0168]|uniref:hypothetical protein n=1 Tax=Bacillus sp. FSL M8-0168 TaxID=2921614 RepID=UPI0030FDD511